VCTQIDISKDQFAKFSGAIVAGLDPELNTGYDINEDEATDDYYTGGHLLAWYDVADPSWTATFRDMAVVGTENVQLHQSVTDADVTIKAENVVNDPAIFQIIGEAEDDPVCEGLNEIWQGYYGYGQTKLGDGDPELNDLRDMTLDYVQPMAQLTEVGASISSDVSLKQMCMNDLCGPWTTTLMDGSASLGASFANACLDPGVELTIDMDSVDFHNPDSKFSFWWTEDLDMYNSA
jgi:hypothetical protein